MRNFLGIGLLLIVAFPASLRGQPPDYSAVVNNLNSLYKKYGASKVSEPIAFDNVKRILTIDDYNIPISDDTFIQCVKNRKSKGGMRYSAKFYMPGDLITYKGNDMIKKSFLGIPISDKSSCKAFIFQLEQLKKE